MNQKIAPIGCGFFIGLVSSFVLVTACSVSMQLHVLREPEGLLTVCMGVLVMSIPSAAIAALIFRRRELTLVLGSQVFVIILLAVWFGLRRIAAPLPAFVNPQSRFSKKVAMTLGTGGLFFACSKYGPTDGANT
jgi:hypothetical protein